MSIWAAGDLTAVVPARGGGADVFKRELAYPHGKRETRTCQIIGGDDSNDVWPNINCRFSFEFDEDLTRIARQLEDGFVFRPGEAREVLSIDVENLVLTVGNHGKRFNAVIGVESNSVFNFEDCRLIRGLALNPCPSLDDDVSVIEYVQSNVFVVEMGDDFICYRWWIRKCTCCRPRKQRDKSYDDCTEVMGWGIGCFYESDPSYYSVNIACVARSVRPRGGRHRRIRQGPIRLVADAGTSARLNRKYFFTTTESTGRHVRHPWISAGANVFVASAPGWLGFCTYGDIGQFARSPAGRG